MKAISLITATILCLLLVSSPLCAGSDQASGDPSASTTQAASVLTNLMERLGKFAPKIHIETLTLNLNGYALVGLHNALNAPVAEQSSTHAASPNEVSGVTTQAVARVEPRDGLLRLDADTAGQSVANQTNLLAVVSNLLHAAEQSGIGLHIGRMTLNLNGYALVGATNSLEGLKTTQRLNPDPAVHPSSPGSPNTARITTQTLRVGAVVLDLNGSAALSLNSDEAKSTSPPVADEQH